MDIRRDYNKLAGVAVIALAYSTAAFGTAGSGYERYKYRGPATTYSDVRLNNGRPQRLADNAAAAVVSFAAK